MRSLRHIPTNLAELVEKDYLAGFQEGHKKNTHLFPPHDHPLSYAFVVAEARLQSADYLQFEMLSPVRIGTYSLIKVHSQRFQKILGGPAFLKVVESAESAQSEHGPFKFQAHLCNLVEALKTGDKDIAAPKKQRVNRST